MNYYSVKIYPMKLTKLKYQLYILQIIISLVLFIFLGFTYYLYQNQYKININTHIQNEILINKKEIISSIKNATNRIKNQKDYFKSINLDVLNLLKKNPNLDLYKLKKDIKSKYLSSNIDIEFYLIDKTYKIYKTTYEKDLGFNLSVVTEAKKYLDKTRKDGNLYISDFLSTDALDLKYKLYSYSKLNENSYLEVGFIDNTLTNTIQSLLKDDDSLKSKITLYALSKDDKQYYYYPLKTKNDERTKEEYYKSFIKVPLNKSTRDSVINSVKFDSQINLVDNNHHIVYTKVFDENIYDILGFENIILKLDVDITRNIKFMKNYTYIFIASLLIIFILLILMMIFIKKRFTNPIEKILDSMHKSKRVDCSKTISYNNELSELTLKYNDLYDKLKKEIKLNKELTLIDSLTQCYNRKAYDDTINEVLSLFSRYKTPFSLVLLDIDDFKLVNDNYGHNIGDDVLKGLVNIVNSNMRNTDTLYRIGGEEFIIICKNTTEPEVIKFAEKLRVKIESSVNIIEEKTITVSIGVTEVFSNDTKDSIYKRVDDNLYHSKNNGKNKVSTDISMNI